MNNQKFISEKANKKIWIDLENSPHVLFFNPIIKELEKQGYQVVVTARDYAQVFGLADLFHLKYKKIGHHFGKNKILKVVGLVIRALQFIPILIAEKPDIALSHGSRSQVVIAVITRLPSITATDYEHGQRLPFIRPTLVMVPDVMPQKVIKKHAKAISKYPGIKEDVYIQNFVPNSTILKSLGIDDKEVVVTIRPPATVAHYHNSESDELFVEVVDYLCCNPNTRIIIVPRTEEQSVKIRKKWPKFFEIGKIMIPEQVVDGLNLIWYSDMVLSGGGTMIREAAALNVPAYSFFRGTIGAIDKYLSETGRLTLLNSVEDVHNKIMVQKRHRPPRPDHLNSKALQCIVDKIIEMVDGTSDIQRLAKIAT